MATETHEIARNTCRGAYGSQYTQILSIVVNSQSIATNTSNVTITYTNQNTAGTAGNYGYANPATITLTDTDGTKSNSYSNSSTDYRNGAVVTLGSWTTNVKHNINGALTLSISASFSSTSSSLSGGSVTGTYTLSTIPRKATIISAPNFNDEENPTIEYSNSAGNSVTTLQACISLDGSNADIPYRDISKTGTSYTFNLTTAERTILRNATIEKTRTVKFLIKTIIGKNTYYSESEKTLTIVNANPVFSNFTYADTNSTVTTVTGNNQILIKGLSTLQATISTANKMVAQKGATETNYTATIESNTDTQPYSSSNNVLLNLGTINSSGIKRLFVRAYDSRNNYTEIYKDISIIDYAKPVINASITRLNNFESTTTLQVNGTYSRVTINNTDKNTIIFVQYRYREKGGTWGNWINFTKTVSNGTYSCTNVVLNLDNTKAFEFEIKTTDTLQQTTTLAYTVDIGQAIFFISSNLRKCYINGNEVAILNSPAFTGIPTAPTASVGTNTTQIANTAFVQSIRREMINLLHPVGEVFTTTDSTFNPNNSWGGTWEKLTADAYLKIVTSNAGSTDGTSSEHKIPLSSMPSHSHTINTCNGAAENTQSDKVVSAGPDAGWNHNAHAERSILDAGGGQPYYPYYYGVIAWHRIA